MSTGTQASQLSNMREISLINLAPFWSFYLYLRSTCLSLQVKKIGRAFKKIEIWIREAS